ncbi:MAG: 2-amino-4-ketopentanoate thiolase alpha subunit [Firmicutes bacterium]|nr:2-amino-4-ketopentanoate thiolase alpha subunit [candidate division NPL-UPA2 bacterium]MBT9154358.1 2-amino-4-ketopentanoate thiolase alpha subunit [candidate division NPL-UPA2 bacterium]
MGSHVGQFVEISWIAIDVSERAANVPESTRQVPLVARVKGFALERGEMGQETEVLTLAGRRIRGTLINLSPRHNHGFGEPQPELLRVGGELRRELEA